MSFFIDNLAFFLPSASATARSLIYSACVAFPQPSLDALIDFDCGAGWRDDSLNWNIAGYNNKPDVLSELKWKDLHSYVIAGNGVIELFGFHIHGSADYGKIFDGSNQDSDFLASHRRMEYLRSIAESDKGEVFDLSIGVGKLYSIAGGLFSFSPTAGYALHEQHLQMHDGEIVVNKVTDFLGPISGLQSSYKARWKGAFMGIDASICLSRLLVISATYERHWPSFFGTGHWNMRDDFYDDFQHHAHGQGTIISLAGKMALAPLVGVSLSTCYQTMKTGKGVDKTFINYDMFDEVGKFLGTVPIESETQLNEVNWHAFSVVFSFNCAL